MTKRPRVFSLAPGTRGGAILSECGRYRRLLWREWGNSTPVSPFVLWIGLNPSTADGEKDDPTVRRELSFTNRLSRLSRYVKVNVMDYRATDPRQLLELSVLPRSKDNLVEVRRQAFAAQLVIIACGNPPVQLKHYATETIKYLKSDGIDLWCLGRNFDGYPKHPLYLSGGTQLTAF